METIKLYYQDAFLRRFDATVLDCAADKKAWRRTGAGTRPDSIA